MEPKHSGIQTNDGTNCGATRDTTMQDSSIQKFSDNLKMVFPLSYDICNI